MIVGKTKGRLSKLPLSAPLDVGADHQFPAPSENGRTAKKSHGISEGPQPVRYIPKENHKFGSMRARETNLCSSPHQKTFGLR
jgi:hypothetical protein